MSEIVKDPPPAPAPRQWRWRWRPPLAHIEWRSKVRWFAAEYLIVVLGVLTAVSINVWWAGRQDAAREAQALERLHQESEAVVGYLRRNIAQRDALIRSHRAAVAALEPGATSEPELDTFREGVFFAFTYPALSPPRSVYDEVIGAGQFGGLSSVEVRSAISAYYGSLNGLQNLLTFFRQTAQPGLEMTMEYPFAYDPESEDGMRIMADPASLREDRRIQNLLLFGLRNQIAFQRQRRALYEDAVAMCEALADAVSKECEAARTGEAGTGGSP